MSTRPDPVAYWRGRMGYYNRRDQYNPEKLAEARKHLAEAKAFRAIERAIEQADNLSDESRARLVGLLVGHDGGDA